MSKAPRCDDKVVTLESSVGTDGVRRNARAYQRTRRCHETQTTVFVLNPKSSMYARMLDDLTLRGLPVVKNLCAEHGKLHNGSRGVTAWMPA